MCFFFDATITWWNNVTSAVVFLHACTTFNDSWRLIELRQNSELTYTYNYRLLQFHLNINIMPDVFMIRPCKVPPRRFRDNFTGIKGKLALTVLECSMGEEGKRYQGKPKRQWLDKIKQWLSNEDNGSRQKLPETLHKAVVIITFLVSPGQNVSPIWRVHVFRKRSFCNRASFKTLRPTVVHSCTVLHLNTVVSKIAFFCGYVAFSQLFLVHE